MDNFLDSCPPRSSWSAGQVSVISFEAFAAAYPQVCGGDLALARPRFRALLDVEKMHAIVAAALLAAGMKQHRRNVPPLPARWLAVRGWEQWAGAELLRGVEFLCRLREKELENFSAHGNPRDGDTGSSEPVGLLGTAGAKDEAQDVAVIDHRDMVAIDIDRIPLKRLPDREFGLAGDFVVVVGQHSQSPSVGVAAPMVPESDVGARLTSDSAACLRAARAS